MILSWSIVACDQGETPDWNAPDEQSSGLEAKTIHAELPPASSVELTVAIEPPKPSSSPTPASDNSSTTGLRFIAYNVENWLTMDRYVERKTLEGAPKPDSEKQAVISLLTRHAPDVLGLCEIGTVADLAEIQEDLKAAGMTFPHTHFTGGSDPTRHLGLLSKFPITSTAKPAETTFQLSGQAFAINRGILDATVLARGKSYRFIGVHLKSKREVDDGDQAAIRLHEARLLRRHVDRIFAKNATPRLVVYGDFNDTRSTSAVKTITGKYNDPTYLTAIPARDSRQTAWTHHWAIQDIYSRIDFVTVSADLKSEVDFSAAKIIDDDGWDQASDHRAILAIFR